MGLLSWLAVGLLVGLAAGRLMPGRGSGLPTLILAAIGALVGGYVSVYFNWGTLASLHPRALLLALAGALLLAAVARVIRR